MAKAIWTPTNQTGEPGLFRFFDNDDAVFGDKYKGVVDATLVDRRQVALIEALQGGVEPKYFKAMIRECLNLGVVYVRWNHTNNHGTRHDYCFEVATGKLRRE